MKRRGREYVQKEMSIQRFEDLVKAFHFISEQPSARNLAAERKNINKFIVRIEKDGERANSLFVSQLHEMFRDFSDKMFAFSPEEFFRDLLNALSEVYPSSAKVIRRYIDAFGFQLADGAARENILLQGEIQSGKTELIVVSALCYLASGRDVFVITRTRTQDKEQFLRRFAGIVNYLEINRGLVNKNFMAIDGKKPAPAHPCAFVEIFHTGNLCKLFEKTKQRDLKNAVVFIDEADLRDTYNAKLFTNAGKVVYVSATVQDILVADWRIKAANVVSLVPSGLYKGIRSLRIEARALEDANEFFYTLCDIAVDNEFQKFHLGHPKIVLINIDRTLKVIGDMFWQFKEDQFNIDGVLHHIPKEMKDVCLIKYTGEGIKMHHSSFAGRKDVVKQHRLHSIAGTLNWLSKNGGNALFPNIVIIAGQMADRGINFADHESGWHLTHQVMIKSADTSCASALQGCRILGTFSDLIPLKLYTTERIKSKIEKSYTASNSIIRQLQESKIKEEFTDSVCAKEVQIKQHEAEELDKLKFITRGKKRVQDSFKICVTKGNNDVLNNEENGDSDGDEDSDEENEGWIVARNESQRLVYNQLKEVLGRNWMKRSDALSRLENKDWDIRKLLGMRSEERRASNIAYRKRDRQVEYRLVKISK